MPDIKPILIVGPGAIGLLTAARMLEAGQPVALMDHRPDRAAGIRRVTLRQGNATKDFPLTATANPASAATCKYILICVKAWATETVATQLEPFMAQDTRILSLQNGIGNFEILAQLPCAPYLRVATTSYGARKTADDAVEQTGNGRIQIASTSADDTIAQAWQKMLMAAGFEVELVEDQPKMLWYKLVINAALNPVAARFQIPNGDLPLHHQAWQMASDILKESVGIARHMGIDLNPEVMLQALRDVCTRTANNQSSMLVDARAGKKLELDAINGAIVRTADSLNLPAPYNKATLASGFIA